jgi:hypothetical protein
MNTSNEHRSCLGQIGVPPLPPPGSHSHYRHLTLPSSIRKLTFFEGVRSFQRVRVSEFITRTTHRYLYEHAVKWCSIKWLPLYFQLVSRGGYSYPSCRTGNCQWLLRGVHARTHTHTGFVTWHTWNLEYVPCNDVHAVLPSRHDGSSCTYGNKHANKRICSNGNSSTNLGVRFLNIAT